MLPIVFYELEVLFKISLRVRWGESSRNLMNQNKNTESFLETVLRKQGQGSSLSLSLYLSLSVSVSLSLFLSLSLSLSLSLPPSLSLSEKTLKERQT